MLQHSLFSQDQDRVIAFFDKFNKEDIKAAIIEHLTNFPDDVLEHCKEYPKGEIGQEIINFYQMNKGVPSKVVMKGDREYYKKLV